MSIYSQEKCFYVYQYIRRRNSKNGFVGSPYYIGKGKMNRAFCKNRKIHFPATKDQIQFVARDMNEADAFQLEILLIHRYGRLDKGTGILRNQTNGGEGGSGLVHSEETKLKRVAVRRKHGSLKQSKTSVEKQIATRRANGSYIRTAESIAKQKASRRVNGTLNTNTSISRQKSYETKLRNDTLRYKPESLVKQLATKRRKGLLAPQK